MYISTLVSELIESVRDGLDEFNEDQIKPEKILKALNRAKRQAISVISRKYEDAFLAYTLYTATAEEQEVDIPKQCFAAKIERIEYIVGGKPSPMRRISFRKGTSLEARQSVGSGVYAWCQVGNKIKVFNKLTSGQQLRIWYTRQTEPLVLEQGRLTLIDQSSNKINVHSIGEDLTSESEGLDNYVNIVDGQTGEVKVSLQISYIDGNSIYFKSVPDRLSVMNKDISAAIPDDVQLDDYICVSRGSCVSEVYEAFVDYLVEYAVVLIKRSIGEDGETDYIALEELKKDLELVWSGRESTMTVTRKSRRWNSAIRRYTGRG